MRTFKDGIAGITGAASGTGRAIANRFAQEGMKIVLSDVESHVVNTASRVERVSYPHNAADHGSKHAVVAISEKLPSPENNWII